MSELLTIHSRTDASYSLEGTREVRDIAIPQTIRNISYRHGGVLQYFAGGTEACVTQHLVFVVEPANTNVHTSERRRK
jgi:hypothetical protein